MAGDTGPVGDSGTQPLLRRFPQPTIARTAALALLVACSLAYFPLNHGTGSTRVLYTNLDRSLGVVPGFAVPYLLMLPLYWLMVVWAFATGVQFWRLVAAATVVAAVSALTFLVFQTYAPRPALRGSGWATHLVRRIYAGDHPYNDFPSGHASSATLWALYWWSTASRRVALLPVVLAVSVVAATVLIKQHSIAGAAAGVVLGAFCWVVMRGPALRLARADAGVEQDHLD